MPEHTSVTDLDKLNAIERIVYAEAFLIKFDEVHDGSLGPEACAVTCHEFAEKALLAFQIHPTKVKKKNKGPRDSQED